MSVTPSETKSLKKTEILHFVQNDKMHVIIA